MCHARGVSTVEWSLADVAERWPVPSASDDKYSRGIVGIVAGSEAYPGAAVLSVSGAARAGAGLVRYVGPRRAQDLVLAARPETIVYGSADAAETLPRARAWVVGPGVTDYPEQDAAIGSVAAHGLPMVVDAGALDAVAVGRAAGAREAAADRVLLTPHTGELVRTLGALRHDVTRADVEHDRAGHARLLAETARATVLLKGSVTVIASPGGALVWLPEAHAVARDGRVGRRSRGYSRHVAGRPAFRAADAAACAAWIHARAALLASAGGPITALDIATTCRSQWPTCSRPDSCAERHACARFGHVNSSLSARGVTFVTLAF